MTRRALGSRLYAIWPHYRGTKPNIVVAPHPRLDPISDHLFATVALGEALQSAGLTAGRMFLYTVHNRRSELWPFGPAGSGVALLPILPEDGVCASGFYSHGLSVERQRQKFVALEAMHDVRDLQWPRRTYQQVGRSGGGGIAGIGAWDGRYAHQLSAARGAAGRTILCDIVR